MSPLLNRVLVTRHEPAVIIRLLGATETAEPLEDIVMLGGFQQLNFDFTADNPGLTLFHCHQQLHMDFGFMALFEHA